MSTVNPKNVRYAWRRLVVRDPDLTDATRRVLLELESHTNPDGTNAHPGIDRLATVLRTKTGTVNEKTVRRALEAGVNRGYIERTRKGGGGQEKHDNADTYRLTLPAGEERPADSVEEGDADSVAIKDPEPVVQRQDADQTNETVDTQMSTDHPKTGDAPDSGRSRSEAKHGHPDAHLRERRHSITHQDGPPEVANSRTQPTHSGTAPAQSASSQPPLPAADIRSPLSPSSQSLSRHCEKHPGGTPNSCIYCKEAREGFEGAEAARKLAEDQRVAADSKTRREAELLAVEACSLCDEYGYRNRRVCNHRPDQDRINAEGIALVRAALGKGRTKIPVGVPEVDNSSTRAGESVRSQAVRSFRSGDDTGRAASRAELGGLKPAPIPTGLAPDSAVRTDRTLQASVG